MIMWFGDGKKSMNKEIQRIVVRRNAKKKEKDYALYISITREII